MPRVSRAIAAFHPIFDEMLPGWAVHFAPVLSEIEQFCQGYREIPFFRPSQPPARRVEVMADSRRGPTRLMSIVPSLQFGDFVDNAVQSAVNPESLRYFDSDAARAIAGIAKKQIATQLSISEKSSRAELRTFSPNSAQTTELMLQD